MRSGTSRAVLLSGWLAAGVAAASDLDGWRAGPVSVSRVYGHDILELSQEGRSAPFRVLGLVRLDRSERELLKRARERVRSWTADARVSLLAPRRNARDELTGWLRFVDGQLLSERLLREGLVLLDPRTLEPEVLERLRAAQADAASRAAGVWEREHRDAEFVRRADDRITTVCGDVSGVRPAREGGWALHLGPPYPRHFVTAWIPEQTAAAFGDIREAYSRRHVCVTGRLRPHPVRPRIRVLDPTQIADEGSGHGR